MPTENVIDPYMTAHQVAEWLQVELDWVYDQVQARKIPHFKLGRQLRFNRHQLEDWLGHKAVPAMSK